MTNDHALLTQLRSTFEAIDPVPRNAVDLARATLAWRDPDAALAELLADSLTDGAPVRAHQDLGPRLLTFQADELTIEIEVAKHGDTRRVLGQLVPTARAEVTIRWTDGQMHVQADDMGRFSASGIPAGPVSFRSVLEGSTRAVSTSWADL